MKYYSLILLLVVAIFVGCGESKVKKSSPSAVVGTILGHKGTTLSLLKIGTRDVTVVDSITLDEKGNFAFRDTPNGFGFYILQLKDGETILPIILEEGKQFSLQTKEGQTVLNADITDSKINSDLQKYFQIQDKDRTHLEQMYAYWDEHKYDNNADKIKDSLLFDTELIEKKHRKMTDMLIMENPESPISLMVISQRLGSKKLYDYNKDKKIYAAIDSALIAAFPTNIYVLDLHERLSKSAKEDLKKSLAKGMLEVGKIAPDIILADTNGTMYDLKALRGKNVLLGFTGGWQAQSYKDIQMLRDWTPTLKKSNVEIYMVCMDLLRDSWVRQSKNALWPILCDQKGAESPIATLYNLPNRLPFYYLLDVDGKILAKGFTIEKLPEILSKVGL